MPRTPTSVAVFVSPHGFGHAARACAIMTALNELIPRLRFEVFTTVPEWFFSDSLPAPFSYHCLATDIGLVQRTSLCEDLQATLARLDDELPFPPERVDRLARQVRNLGCSLVISDIAPLGLAAAHQAGVPGVLIENFTWDWIYDGYVDECPQIARHSRYLARLFAMADLHIQTTPACRRLADAAVTAPVSRQPTTPRLLLRRLLGVSPGRPMVLLTMGGVDWDYGFLRQLEDREDGFFVVPGASAAVERRGCLVTLPKRSSFYHPDLVHASDLVVGKLGYSTLAEVFAAGCAFAFVARPRFPESPLLARFALREMPATEISEDELTNGAWLDRLGALLAQPRTHDSRPNGAAEAAQLVGDLLENTG